MRLAPILVMAALSGAAQAEELGQITAFLDGETRVWHMITFPQGGKTVFTATMEQRPSQAELLLQGHPVPEFTSRDVLSVDAKFKGQYTLGEDPIIVDILYTPNGLAGPIWTSRGAPTPPRLDIVEFDSWGGVGQIVAVVSGEICKRARLFSRTDPSDCKRLNGKIVTRIEMR